MYIYIYITKKGKGETVFKCASNNTQQGKLSTLNLCWKQVTSQD